LLVIKYQSDLLRVVSSSTPKDGSVPGTTSRESGSLPPGREKMHRLPLGPGGPHSPPARPRPIGAIPAYSELSCSRTTLANGRHRWSHIRLKLVAGVRGWRDIMDPYDWTRNRGLLRYTLTMKMTSVNAEMMFLKIVGAMLGLPQVKSIFVCKRPGSHALVDWSSR